MKDITERVMEAISQTRLHRKEHTNDFMAEERRDEHERVGLILILN